MADPAGQYQGEQNILGLDIKVALTIEDANYLDFVISGAASIDCKQVLYKVSGSTVSLPNVGTAGDCVHDALAEEKITLNSISYDSSTDTITVNVKKVIKIAFLLKHVGGTQSAMAVEAPAVVLPARFGAASR